MNSDSPKDAQNDRQNAGTLDKAGKNRLVAVTISTTLFILVAFIAAGRFDWLWGWVYFGLTLAVLLGNSFYILKTNPQAINERGRKPTDQKGWDKLVMAVYNPILFAFPIVVGLDIRYSNAQLSIPLHLLGGLGFLLGNQIIYWAMANNPFLATYVTVQDQRGHTVAQTGPYRFVRHPMYLGMIISWLGQPFLLGSWLGLIPAALAIVIILIRTHLEDRTLTAELSGYAEYSRQVRFRLVPGVW